MTTSTPRTSRRCSAAARRGSALITAMILAALLAIALSSYATLSTHTLQMSTRTYYDSEAVNMAESAVEEATWSLNQANAGDPTAWDGWDRSSGTSATRTMSDFTLSANATGSVKVYVDRYDPPASFQPTVVARASVVLPDGQQLTKTIEVKLKRRSLFAAGLVALTSIRFNGNNASVDSWISNPDLDPSTAAVPYSTTVRRDKGSVGATAGTATVSVGNADIWGTAAVGGSSTSAISVGSNGHVGPFGTSSGVKDPASMATDFTASLIPVSAPTGGTIIAAAGASIGTDGTATTWRLPAISSSLTVYGQVTLVLTAGAGTPAISITGGNGITLAPGATLTIYTEGDVNIAGNGLLNPSAQPETFQLWGTSTAASPQDIHLAGNGALKGVVYAPNANVSIDGNGDVMGAAVGNSITITGNAAFHYDESLANWGATTPWGISRWRELITPTDRAVYDTQLAF